MGHELEAVGVSEPYEMTESGWDSRGYASFVRFLEAIGAGSRKASLLRRDGVVASVAPAAPERSLFNSVAYESAAALEAAHGDLRAAYSDAGVKAWTVWVPGSDTKAARFLGDRGHRLDGSPRQMAIDLEDVPPLMPEVGAAVGRVEWSQLCALNDTAWDHERGTFLAGIGAKPDQSFRAYGAHANGWLASVLATLLHDGDCFVAAVATLPEARGRGLEAGLAQKALLDARRHGCETSSLQASPISRSVYERLGYRDLGSLEMWEHRVFAS